MVALRAKNISRCSFVVSSVRQEHAAFKDQLSICTNISIRPNTNELYSIVKEQVTLYAKSR